MNVFKAKADFEREAHKRDRILRRIAKSLEFDQITDRDLHILCTVKPADLVIFQERALRAGIAAAQFKHARKHAKKNPV